MPWSDWMGAGPPPPPGDFWVLLLRRFEAALRLFRHEA
jgi:hypothetical protein